MKIFAISDLHLSINSNKPMNIFGPQWDNYLDIIEKDWQAKVSNDDIVLIAGDISWAMKLDDAIPDLKYINKWNGKKVIIRGNHDFWWSSIGGVRAVLPEGMYAIQNDAIRFDGVVLCGTRGWVVPEYIHKSEQDKKIYERELMRLKLSLDTAKRIKQEGDILICMIHYPPFNSKLLDSDFTKLFEEYGVEIVVYGHLHGENVYAKEYHYKNGVKYYLTSCDLVKNKLTELAIIE